MSRRVTVKSAFDVAVAAAAACLAAWASSAYSGEHGPFEEGSRPRVFRTGPCRLAARGEAAGGGAEFQRSDRKPPRARARLVRYSDSAGVFMSVRSTAGGELAPAVRISESHRRAAVLWADLNGDGREDFIALVVTGEVTAGGPVCDVGFALSSGRGYRVTVVRTVAAGGSDFIDAGEGTCRFVQTSFVCGEVGEGETAFFRGYFVYNLLEFRGDRVVLCRADGRFPKWVEQTAGENHGDAGLTDDEKAMLWMTEPDRIFRRTPSPEKTRRIARGGRSNSNSSE